MCPQFDALDKITTQQQLSFYARIKGVKHVKRDVNLVMRRVGLTACASRRTDKLSGSNKRKLSLAIALLGALKRLNALQFYITNRCGRQPYGTHPG